MKRFSLGFRLARAAPALLLARPGGRSFKASFAWTAVLVACGIAVFYSGLFGRRTFNPGLHTAISLNQALMRTHCGRSGPVSPRVDVYAIVSGEPRLMRQPFVTTIVATAGSIEAYCSEPSPNFLNNENSLMLAMQLGLRLNPRLSPLGLARWLRGLHVLMVAALVLVALACGAPVLLTGAALAAICSILSAQDLYHVYDFFIPILVAAPAGYVAVHRWGRPDRVATLAAASAAAGVATAFFVNFRSSFLPIYVVMFAIFLAASRFGVARRVFAARAALGVVAFGVGFWAFSAGFIKPLQRTQNVGYNFSYHVIMHPIVLSLGLPRETPLSAREGIIWDDSVGEQLARRMLPDADYLGHNYEKALLLYYMKLWVLYPGEMLQIYRAKLAAAGTGAFATAGSDSERLAVSRAISLVGVVRNGVTLLSAFVVLFALTAWWFVRTKQPLALLLVMLSAAAILMMIEAVLIMPRFILNYHGYLLFSIALLQLLAVQAFLEGAARLLARRPGRVPYTQDA